MHVHLLLLMKGIYPAGDDAQQDEACTPPAMPPQRCVEQLTYMSRLQTPINQQLLFSHLCADAVGSLHTSIPAGDAAR
jgi:hypothetical protein